MKCAAQILRSFLPSRLNLAIFFVSVADFDPKREIALHDFHFIIFYVIEPFSNVTGPSS